MNDVVDIADESPNDNFITNRTDRPVSIACKEMWGASQFSLQPAETKRMTFDVSAAPFPLGEYSYDDLKYDIGRGQKWQVRSEEGQLIMLTAGTPEAQAPEAQAPTVNEQLAEKTPLPPANWYADPKGRHQYRYWDGTSWTSTVADDGQASVDSL